jgi:hypothetical protein
MPPILIVDDKRSLRDLVGRALAHAGMRSMSPMRGPMGCGWPTPATTSQPTEYRLRDSELLE